MDHLIKKLTIVFNGIRYDFIIRKVNLSQKQEMLSILRSFILILIKNTTLYEKKKKKLMSAVS